MSIDWNAFTPWSSLTGGVMIGLAAAMLLLLNGRIAGVSGITGASLRPRQGDVAWRLLFLLGLLSAPLLYRIFAATPAIRIDASGAALAAAGLLVGVGTRYGGGCTSGHGVCGLSRLSARSLVATLTFMAAGMASVFIARHLLGG